MSPPGPWARLVPSALRPFLTIPSLPSDRAGRLATILGVEPSELAAIRLGPRLHYRPHALAKPDGEPRRILAPSRALKRLQRRLLDGYLARIPVHPAATAYRRGGSALVHARRHALGRVVATVDLRDFFEATRGARVARVFRAQGWRDEELGVLMRLCTFRDGLPQGAPTSPCLSNLVNARLDERLHALAMRSGANYSRYADDLAFSWDADRPPAGFARDAEELIRAAGYEVQPRKGWTITRARDRPVVTGIILSGDGRLRVAGKRPRPSWLGWRPWQTWDAADAYRPGE